ncbi:glycerophosphodiester phosphodiesterase [Helicobacter mesocricetorum]|uniref:glycerophosphodiester phosphodiesterase n=1 Tax=Helicobacter mesocricetorum TaxID=87012 RepID=UPI000CF07C70|nr:glycerophosphodiester phosphodiesterase [Helicobacter mesocricetorum]
MKNIFLGIFLGVFCLAQPKLIIAHRGASGYLPEHTLEAKVLAYALNANYIEQDLAMSKDDHLIVIHDLYLDKVSDVKEKFPNRARKDGHYYVIDFTLDELRKLRMSEAFSWKNQQRNPIYPQRFPVGKSYFTLHTFEEEIELIEGLNQIFGKDIGLYVEIKKPWFHTQEGKDIAKKTLEVLKSYGYTTKDSKVYLQSFDYPNLLYIKKELFPKMNMDLKLIALVDEHPSKETYEFIKGEWRAYDFSYLLRDKNYAEIAKNVDGLGIWNDLIFDIKKSKKGSIVPNNIVKNAHLYGLEVHTYTGRSDALPSYASSFDELLEAVLFKAGADGIFTDFPDTALKFVQEKNMQK